MKIILGVLVALTIHCFAFGQDQFTKRQIDNGSWEFNVAPYIWMASASGNISYSDRSLPVTAEFKDVLKNLKMAAFLRAEAKKGNWFIMGDLFYIKVSKGGRIAALSVDAQVVIKQTIVEVGGGYNLVNSNDWFYMDGIAGLRYFSINNTIEIGSQKSLDKNTSTIDPFIGVRFRTFWNKWMSRAYFDAGGFGIGSELSWKANILTGYKFSELFSAHLGFQSYGIDYEKGDFSFNNTIAGPLAAINFHF